MSGWVLNIPWLLMLTDLRIMCFLNPVQYKFQDHEDNSDDDDLRR